MCILAVGLGALFNRSLVDYLEATRVAPTTLEAVSSAQEYAPSAASLIW